MLINKRLRVNDNSADGLWATFDLPVDYDSNPEPCALLIVLLGVGQAGNGTEADVSKLYQIGPLVFSQKGKRFVFNQLQEKKAYRFIIAVIQGRNNTKVGTQVGPWAALPNEVDYALKNDILKNFRINTDCIALAGISAGGSTVAELITTEAGSSYCAAIMLSQASGGTNYTIPVKYGMKVWQFIGSNDLEKPFKYATRLMNEGLNKLKAGTARLTTYPGGHGDWDQFFDPAKPDNIYEFILANKRNVKEPVPEVPPVIVPEPPKPPPVEPPKPPVVEPPVVPPPVSISKIPIDIRRFYQNNNFEHTPQALFDGDLLGEVKLGYGQLLEKSEIRYEFPDDLNVIIHKFRFYDGQGTLISRPLKIYGMNSDWKKILLATFTGEKYNEWVEISVTNPIKYKYLVFEKDYQGGTHNLPTELELLGTFNKDYKEPGLKPIPPKPFKNYLGINTYEWDLLQDAETPWKSDVPYEPKWKLLKAYNNYRHYLDWRKIEIEEGKYTFSPTKDGSWYLDNMYERMKEDGRLAVPCIKGLPKWMEDTYPEGDNHENVPVKAGKDFSDPKSYIEYSKMYFQFVARYGSTKVDTALLSVAYGNTIKTGLGFIKWVEVENERDKWWKGRKGYQTGREYAAMLSAVYDGHLNTMGKGIGVKNADPNIKVAIGGTALSYPDWARGIVDWCKEFRNGSLPFDAYNYHFYSNDSYESQAGTATRGVSPEAGTLSKFADDYTWFNQNFGGNKEIWQTEYGYDIAQTSPFHVPPVGKRTVLQTQADWIIRAALKYSEKRHDRLFFYQHTDDNVGGGMFGSSGFINNDLTRRPVLNYIEQANKILGEYSFDSVISEKPSVHKYLKGDKELFVAWMPTEKGETAVYNHPLKSSLFRLKTYSFVDDTQDMKEGFTNSLVVTETPIIYEVTTVPLIKNENYSPLSEAGKDIEITGTSVTLNGSASIDTDGEIKAYKWAKKSGTGSRILSSTRASTTVTGLTKGTYVFKLTVTDNNNYTATDDITVTVK